MMNKLYARGEYMAKRIFISFAMEDKTYRDFLIGQARNENSPFEFVDMSVKEPWSDSWKTRCRTRIKGCDGTIALVSHNTKNAEGQLWEISCSKQEGVPIRGIYVDANNKPASLPSELNGVRVVEWTWRNIENFVENS
jgi:hypothetical protein